jgi:hypothetical protein
LSTLFRYKLTPITILFLLIDERKGGRGEHGEKCVKGRRGRKRGEMRKCGVEKE